MKDKMRSLQTWRFNKLNCQERENRNRMLWWSRNVFSVSPILSEIYYCIYISAHIGVYYITWRKCLIVKKHMHISKMLKNLYTYSIRWKNKHSFTILCICVIIIVSNGIWESRFVSIPVVVDSGRVCESHRNNPLYGQTNLPKTVLYTHIHN